MTFKYRFIYSFVLLEIFFIFLIVLTNFSTIKNLSNNLINQSIDSNIQLLEQFLKVPLSIKDVATIDNFFLDSDELEYVNTIIVLDEDGTILTTKYNFEFASIEEMLTFKGRKSFSYNDEHFIFSQKDIFDEERFLGSLFIIFDITKNKSLIKKNKYITFMIVLIEILISTVLSYIIGHKLTEMLTRLTQTAKQIGENKNPRVPFQNRKDEIGIFAKSMHKMLKDLKTRNKRLKELGEQLKSQKNNLIKANIHKDEFLANMSHELKTPLNSINVISSVMMKNKHEKLDEKQVKNLQIINSCGNDLLNLINDILDISKIKAGELVITKEKINVKDLFVEIYEMFEPQVFAKGLTFRLDIDDKLDFIVSDSMRIKQIIKNLVNNSIKFTDQGGIYIEVKDIENEILVKVSDDGIGISSDKLPNIFDRFKQADGTINRKFGGTGLGLSITKELSEMLGGKINVSSIEGAGTTFEVYLAKSLLNSDSEEVSSYNSNKINDINKFNVQKNHDIQSTQIVKDKIQDTIKDTSKYNNNLVSKTDKKILLLNQDPLSFMQLVIDLKKSYELIQISSIERLKEEVKNNEYGLVMIDTTKLNIDDVITIPSFYEGNVAIISSDDNDLSNPLVKDFPLKVKKPFNKNLLKEEIQKIFA